MKQALKPGRSPLLFTLTLMGSVVMSCCLMAVSAQTTAAPPVSTSRIAEKASDKITKEQAIAQARSWRERLLERDLQLENKIGETMTKSLHVSVLSQEGHNPLDDIQSIDDERLELKARIQILDQLVFRFDSKWPGLPTSSLTSQAVKELLIKALLEMAQNDLSQPGQGTWWRFLIQAGTSLKEVAEPGANPIRFLETTMEETTVLTPKPIQEVLDLQTYSGN